MRTFEFVSRMNGVAIGHAKLPERSTAVSAGYDFFNPEMAVILPNEIKYVRTGIKAAFPKGEMLMLCNRSSNPKKKGLVLVNGVGIVDADYYNNTDNEGEIAFAFMNITNEVVLLEAGEKLGQGIFVKFGLVDDDNAEGDRTGGFGSTGK